MPNPHSRNLRQRRRLSGPPENRPFPEVQTRHAQNGEIAQTQHYATDGHGDDEGDVRENEAMTTLLRRFFQHFLAS